MADLSIITNFTFVQPPCGYQTVTGFLWSLTWPITFFILVFLVAFSEEALGHDGGTKWTVTHLVQQNFRKYLQSSAFWVYPNTDSPRYHIYHSALRAVFSLSAFLSTVCFSINTHDGSYAICLAFCLLMFFSMITKAINACQAVSIGMDLAMVAINVYLGVVALDIIPLILCGVNLVYLVVCVVIRMRLKFLFSFSVACWGFVVFCGSIAIAQTSNRINSPSAVNTGSVPAVNFCLAVLCILGIVCAVLFKWTGFEFFIGLFNLLGFIPVVVFIICFCVQMWGLMGDTNCIHPLVYPLMAIYWPFSLIMCVGYTLVWGYNEENQKDQGVYSIRDIAKNRRKKRQQKTEDAAGENNNLPIFGVPFGKLLEVRAGGGTLDDCKEVRLLERFDINTQEFAFVSHKWLGKKLDTWDGKMLEALIETLNSSFAQDAMNPNLLVWIDGLCCQTVFGSTSQWLKLIPDILKLSRYTIRLTMDVEDYFSSAWCVYEAFSGEYSRFGTSELWVNRVVSDPNSRSLMGIQVAVKSYKQGPWAVKTTMRRDFEGVMKALEARLLEIGEDPTEWIRLSREYMKTRACPDDSVIGTLRRWTGRY